MSNSSRQLRNRAALSALLCVLSTGLALAATSKEQKSALDFKAFFKPDLYISTMNGRLDSLLPQLQNRANWESFVAKRGDVQVYLDARSGAVTNLLERVPLIPGDGYGNRFAQHPQGGREGGGRGAASASAGAARCTRH
jgi:hypothetical protein